MKTFKNNTKSNKTKKEDEHLKQSHTKLFVLLHT